MFFPRVLAEAEGQPRHRTTRQRPTHVSAVIKSASSSSPSVQYLNGLWERSTRAIVSVMILVPNRSLRRVSEAIKQTRVMRNVRRRTSHSPLRAELVHHLGTSHAVREPGEVLDLGGGGELASWGEAVGGGGGGIGGSGQRRRSSMVHATGLSWRAAETEGNAIGRRKEERRQHPFS